MERKMIDAITYTDMLKHIRNNELIEDTIGILITRPDLHTGNDILKSLSYFHHLTGNNINFYLPGYGAYWSGDRYPDMDNVALINGVEWSFSYKSFVDFIADIEEVSRWKYSGESELLLIPYYDEMLDFSKVAVFHLDIMMDDGTISSVSSFITGLSRCVRLDNSVTSIAARGAVKCMSKTAIDEMIDKMPTYISKSLRRGKHYLCRDFSL